MSIEERENFLHDTEERLSRALQILEEIHTEVLKKLDSDDSLITRVRVVSRIIRGAIEELQRELEEGPDQQYKDKVKLKEWVAWAKQ